MFVLVAVALAPLASATGSWMEVGHRNIGQLRIWNEYQAMNIKGKQITGAVIAKMEMDTMAIFAPKMTCAAAQHSVLSFRLEDVSPTECFHAFGALWSNTKVLDFEVKNLAIDPASGGNMILAYEPFDAVGTTDHGETVPGTTLNGLVTTYRHHFNDKGLIDLFEQEFDSTILVGVKAKIQAFSQAQGMRGFSNSILPRDADLEASDMEWASVGKKNIAAVMKLNDIALQLKGKQLTPQVIAQLSDEMQSYYAPRISCQTAKQSSMSVHLAGVTQSECFHAMAQNWGNMKVIDMMIKDVAIDPASGGKTLLIYQAVDFVGVTTSGEEVPNTLVRGLVLNLRYKFNGQGLIDFFEQEYDSGILDSIQMKIMAWSSTIEAPSNLVAKAESWNQVGERNIATLQQLSAMQSELKGKHITPAVITHLTQEMVGSCTPTMSCVVAKGSGLEVHMAQTTPAACFQAMGKVWGNVKVANLVEKNFAVDPKSGGNTILSHMLVDFVGATTSGQIVPDTKMDGMVVSCRYRFNAQGLVEHWEQEFDSGILLQLAEQVMSYSQSQENTALSAAPWTQSHTAASMPDGVTAMVFACAAGVAFALGSGIFWAKRSLRRGPSLLQESF